MKPGKDPLTLAELQKRSDNSANCVLAVFKPAIVGVWHQISGKHMGRSRRAGAFRGKRRRPFEGRLGTLFATKSGPLPRKALLA